MMKGGLHGALHGGAVHGAVHSGAVQGYCVERGCGARAVSALTFFRPLVETLVKYTVTGGKLGNGLASLSSPSF